MMIDHDCIFKNIWPRALVLAGGITEVITDQKALCRDVPETPLVLWALVDSLSSRRRKPP